VHDGLSEIKYSASMQLVLARCQKLDQTTIAALLGNGRGLETTALAVRSFLLSFHAFSGLRQFNRVDNSSAGIVLSYRVSSETRNL
jgi:hypothetical protein